MDPSIVPMVATDAEEAIALFSKRLGWKSREDLWMMSKEVDGND